MPPWDTIVGGFDADGNKSVEASGCVGWASQAKLLIKHWIIPFNGWFEERQETSQVVQMHDSPNQVMMKCTTLSVVHEGYGQNEARGCRI